MTEFQWKDNFINQEKKIEHINKFVLLILMIKVKVGKTTKLERTIPSLKVQDFSVYEEYLKKYILPAEIKNKSKLLHNQPLFKDYVSKIKNDEALKINTKVKQIVFEKFAKYVNLKDTNSEKNARNLMYWFCIPFLINFIFLIKDQKNFNYLFVSLMAFIFLFLWGKNIVWAFQGKSKVFLFNTLRINTELCLLALQEELEVLEKILGNPSDLYKKNTEEQNFELFQDVFPVQDTFTEEEAKKIQVGQTYGFKQSTNNNTSAIFDDYSKELKERAKDSKINVPVPTHEYVFQGIAGFSKMGLGILGYVGVTAYGATEEAVALKCNGQIDPSVGYSMMMGYSASSVLFADGFNLFVGAFQKTQKDSIFWNVFQNLITDLMVDVGKGLSKIRNKETEQRK